jgi:hypothetical protein
MGHAIDSQRKVASVLKEPPDDLQNRVARFCDNWGGRLLKESMLLKSNSLSFLTSCWWLIARPQLALSPILKGLLLLFFCVLRCQMIVGIF